MSQVTRTEGLIGNTAMKAPCRLASTANLAALAGLLTIDGVVTAALDRVLVKDQTTASQNGIYDVDSGAWTRSEDFDGVDDIVQGTTVLVNAGTTNINTYWRVSSANPMTIGTSSITFAAATVQDSASMTFLQAGAGAVSRAAQAKMRDIVNAADFGWAAAATAAVNAAAIMTAIATFPAGVGGTIYLPQGNFACAADVIAPTRPHITIQGAGSAFSVESASKAATNVTFGAGTIGIDLTQSALGRNYSAIRDVSLNGGALCANGIKVLGAALIEHVEVTGCTNAGIWLASLINQTVLRSVGSNYNLTGYGLLVGGAGVTTNTCFTVDHCDFRSNLVGIRIENAYDAQFSNCVIESNVQDGMSLYQPTGPIIRGLAFRNCLWEANNTSAGAYCGIRIDAQTLSSTADTSPHRILFDCCDISEDVAPRACIIATAAQYVRFVNCNTDGDITLSANCYDSGFLDRHITTTAVITDAGGRNYDLTHAYANSFTATLTGCTTAPTYSVKYSVSEDGVVHLKIPQVTGTSNAVTKTLTGLPARLIPVTTSQGVGQGCFVDNGGARAFGLIYVTSAGVIELYSSAAVGAWTAAGTFSSLAMELSYKLT